LPPRRLLAPEQPGVRQPEVPISSKILDIRVSSLIMQGG
jgi:hypothetical protein